MQPLPKAELLDFVEHLPVAVYRSTPSGRLVMANEATVAMLGFATAEELMSMTVSDLYADPAVRTRLVERLEQGEEIPPHEVPLRRKDGEIIWVKVTARAVEDEAGETLFMEGVLENVTDRYRAEAALEASEELFRSAYRSAPQGLAIIGPDLVPRDVNAALCEMLGITKEEFLIGSAERYIHPDQRSDARAKIEALRNGEIDSYQAERQLLRANDKPLWTLIATSAVRAPDGTLAAIVTQVFDITDRRKVQQELSESESLFRSTFADAPTGMLLVSPSFDIIRANPAMCRTMRSTETALRQKTLFDIWREHEDDRMRVQRIMDGTPDRFRTERKLCFDEERDVWALVSISAVHGVDGSPAALLAQFVDVTERHEAEVERRQVQRQLEELIKSKDDLVASVSHELRTPLTTIFGLATELGRNDDHITSDERDVFIRLIADQATEMADLIDDLLVAARAEVGEVLVEPRMIDVKDEVDLVLDAWRAGAASVTCPAGVKAYADPFRVRQVLRNLLTNAGRYGQPPIEIVIESENPLVQVHVQDHGPGLSEDEWDRIFEAYYRAHDRKSVPASVGLGLTVSRHLADVMGGSLRYGVVEGLSTFTLELPAAPPD